MPHVDLAFRLMGTKLPVDHGYALFSAINRLLPGLHDAKAVGVHPIRGRYNSDGTLIVMPFSHLIFRLPDDGLPPYLTLTGKDLDVDGYSLHVGAPEVRRLRPTAVLFARLVTIKGFMEPGAFLEAAKRQLQEMEVTADLQVGQRRTFRVKDKQVVGFEVIAAQLSAEDSVQLQEIGIGGRRRMGCGVFVPLRA